MRHLALLFRRAVGLDMVTSYGEERLKLVIWEAM
jgi:hypothetical protein